jgi:hypothetical protein
MSQRAQDDPRSECRWPKGDGKPGTASAGSFCQRLPDNRPDRGLVPWPERALTRVR